jgi:hypothetical protein
MNLPNTPYLDKRRRTPHGARLDRLIRGEYAGIASQHAYDGAIGSSRDLVIDGEVYRLHLVPQRRPEPQP